MSALTADSLSLSSANPAAPRAADTSRKALWAGRVLSGFASLFLAVDAAMKANVYLRSFLRSPGVMNAQIW